MLFIENLDVLSEGMVKQSMQVSLEQWQMLSAVAEFGGFQRAAEHLGKSQSTISYGVQQLQEKLGVSLLRPRGRQAELTEAGESVLRRARHLLDEARLLEQSARDLTAGWEAELSVCVDAIFPDALLANILEDFAPESRGAHLEIVSSTLSGTQDAIIQRQADLAICGALPMGFLGEPVLPIEFVTVAAPDHPLIERSKAVTEADLRAHRQIVVRDSGQYRRMDAGWLGSHERWTVSHFYQSLQLIKQGLGHARFPRHQIEAELLSGELSVIELEAPVVSAFDCHLVLPKKDNAGPATSLLAEKIRYHCRQWQWLRDKTR
ncbi:MAG: LysR family transcriptional regulator [Candidatus Pelagadaptatus aseana]|uniref:LysR family transcriptional regulator n=1 Tax=Candidatus Pelagadaptatus aseana TaxID=3120508 RepID=UPI0039B1DC30